MDKHPRAHGRLLVIGLIAVALAFVGIGATDGAAWAHDELASTSPANGTVLAGPPTSIVLRFEEPPLADTTKLVAKSADNTDLTLPEPKQTGSTVTTVWPQTAPSGTYKISWRNVGADGHPITGVFSFSYTASSVSPSPSSSVTSSATASTASQGTSSAANPSAAAMGGPAWWLLGVAGVLSVIAVAWVLAIRRRPAKR